MPNSSRSYPAYRLHKPTGKAVVTLSGHDIYLGKFGSRASKAEYDRRLAEWLANGRRFPPESSEAAGRFAVVELAAAYLRFAKTYYRKDGKLTGSIERVRVALRLLNQLYERVEAVDFGPLKLRAIQEHLIEAGKSRRYINHVTEQVKRVFKWGVSMEMFPPAVFQALAAVPGLRQGRTKARDPAPIGPVPDEVVQATLPHLSPVVADMVRFQRLTGCRPGEVCLLRPADLDLTSNGVVWTYTPQSHKTSHHGRSRVIVIGPKAQEILRPYLARAADAYCFSPAESLRQTLDRRQINRTTPRSCGNVAGSNRRSSPRRTPGMRYTTSSYMRMIVRGCEVAFGMPQEFRSPKRTLPVEERLRLLALGREWRSKYCWAPNRLRHTAATEIRKAFGTEAAQVVLGHAHLNITEVYAERDLNKAAAIMAQLG